MDTSGVPEKVLPVGAIQLGGRGDRVGDRLVEYLGVEVVCWKYATRGFQPTPTRTCSGSVSGSG